MLDELFYKERMHLRKVNFLFFGFIMTLVGIFSGILLFGRDSSVAQILIITILFMPAVMRLFKKAEIREKECGAKKLFKNHKDILVVFGLMFLGVFLAFLIVQLVAVSSPETFRELFDYQIEYLLVNEDLTTGLMDSITGEGHFFMSLGRLLSVTLGLVAVCFILSLFYGSGGVFLIVLSASIFSTLMIFLMKMFEFFAHYSAAFFTMFFLLFIPIIGSFILAATGGGVIQKAIISENIESAAYRKVIKDGILFLLISVAIVVVSVPLFVGLFSLLL